MPERFNGTVLKTVVGASRPRVRIPPSPQHGVSAKSLLYRASVNTISMTKYILYIIQCKDGTLYTGISTDLKRRITEHSQSGLGARYTRGRGPFKLVYTKKFNSRSLASKEEYRIKKLSRLEKLVMIDLYKNNK